MAETQEDREAELRGKLVKRLAVAGVMVGVLLAALAFFDYLAAPEEPEAPVYSKPVPVAPKKEVTQPVKPADLPEPPGKSEAAGKDEKSDKGDKAAEEKPAGEAKSESKGESKPEDKGGKAAAKTTTSEPPSKPAVAAKPVVAAPIEKAAARPQSVVSVPAKPASPVGAAKPAGEPSVKPMATAPVRGVPEGTAAPVSRIPDEAALAASATKAVVAPAIPPRTPQPLVAPAPSLPRLLSGYVVQAGVFGDAKAAEELHAKLAMNGIPSTLETRVTVGPFKTREEAEAARQKLKTLGIDPLLIPPPRK